MKDKELVSRLRCGDESAYVEAMNLYGALVLSVVAPMLADARDVEETVQDVFVKAFIKIRNYREHKSSFATWLARIARNAAIDRVRRSCAPELELSDSSSGESDRADEPVDNDLLVEAISRLRGEERVLLNLIYYDGLAPGDAAAVLELTPAVLSSRLYRIKQKLSRIINELRR